MGATSRLYSIKLEIYHEQFYEKVTNLLITHDHHLIKES